SRMPPPVLRPRPPRRPLAARCPDRPRQPRRAVLRPPPDGPHRRAPPRRRPQPAGRAAVPRPGRPAPRPGAAPPAPTGHAARGRGPGRRPPRPRLVAAPPANRSTRAGSPGTDRDRYRAAVLDIDWRDRVAVVRWRDGENRLHRASVDRWHAVLDELEAVEGPLALVVVGEGRFFSNGLDLDALAADRDAARAVVDDVHRLFGRLLLFPAYTVGALNGHTFAAGAMLACCLDARVMREDRGYWCLPEADLGLPLTEAMFAAVTARLPVAV